MAHQENTRGGLAHTSKADTPPIADAAGLGQHNVPKRVHTSSTGGASLARLPRAP